jgi:DNA primase
VSSAVKSSRLAVSAIAVKSGSTAGDDGLTKIPTAKVAPFAPFPKKAADMQDAGRSERPSKGSRRTKEMELCRLLLEDPEIAARHGETLAAMHFSDPLLDRLRHELLNLAASGFRLEKGGLESHFIRAGMAELVERLLAQSARAPAGEDSAEGEDARFLRAAAQLREMAELAPERKRAVERFKSEATEENWLQAQRLLGNRSEE